eukprot:TRINITY_DN2232_c0_g1_i2.p1 TRINITY_DN2232_c0_g1~~TRINITY_DN2232_c0_g1_i2.p1  ORF type:complete len:569 (-),score=144.56 TRINITY_DN2232_c0_g1_i2:611-2296(-)
MQQQANSAAGRSRSSSAPPVRSASGTDLRRSQAQLLMAARPTAMLPAVASAAAVPNDAEVTTPREKVYDVSQVAGWFASQGQLMPGIPIKRVPLQTFVLKDGHALLVCPWFYVIMVSLKRLDVLQLQVFNTATLAPAQSLSPLPTRTVNSIHSPHQIKNYVISPHLNEITQKGTVTKTSIRPSLTRSFASLQTLQSANTKEPQGSKAAQVILHLLHTQFEELRDYTYMVDQPSHQWKEAPIPYAFLEEVVTAATDIFCREPALLFHKPPVYVIGDLHGNFKDLTYFAKAFGLWQNALFVPAKFLFLGDYVDRGPHSVETIAYLLALKVQHPDKVFLLRGNHENPDINGDENSYRDGSFLSQCKRLYGDIDGRTLWQAFNQCFDMLPLASIIDKKVFCVHGGIPRALATERNILESIQKLTRPPDLYSEFIFDLLWSDPATIEEEHSVIGQAGFPLGFGQNSRGPSTCVFGKIAVKSFLEQTGLTHIIRAHQSPQHGVDIAKNATIMTIFSSSHYCGGANRAAAVLVYDGKLTLIISKHLEAAPIVSSITDDYDLVEDDTMH